MTFIKRVIHKAYLGMMAAVIRFMPPDVFTLFAGEGSSLPVPVLVPREGFASVLQRLLVVV